MTTQAFDQQPDRVRRNLMRYGLKRDPRSWLFLATMMALSVAMAVSMSLSLIGLAIVSGVFVLACAPYETQFYCLNYVIFHRAYVDIRHVPWMLNVLWFNRGQGQRLRIPYGAILHIRQLGDEIEIDADIPLPGGDVPLEVLTVGVTPADADAVLHELASRGVPT